MIYRLIVLLNSESEDAILDVKDKILDHLSDFITVNPGQPNEEQSFYKCGQCHHDEHPTLDCALMEEWHSD